MEGLFIAFVAKLALAGLAVIAMRITLFIFDRAGGVNFKDWLEVMNEKHPEKLALFYGLRYIGVGLIFAYILG